MRRYDLYYDMMKPDPDGEFMRYYDHIAALDAARAESDGEVERLRVELAAAREDASKIRRVAIGDLQREHLERTPDGTRMCYWTPSGVVVIPGAPTDDAHNCDAMGCGQEHVVARIDVAELRARVAELEQELSRGSDFTEHQACAILNLERRLAALEAPPVVPVNYEVELMDASGPDDEPFMQWGFCDGTTSDGETSNDDMIPEYRRDLAQLYRALAWAIETDSRPPHESDDHGK